MNCICLRMTLLIGFISVIYIFSFFTLTFSQLCISRDASASIFAFSLLFIATTPLCSKTAIIAFLSTLTTQCTKFQPKLTFVFGPNLLQVLPAAVFQFTSFMTLLAFALCLIFNSAHYVSGGSGLHFLSGLLQP